MLSTMLYKIFIDPLLHMLHASGLGVYLGASCVNSPTCADDVILMANSEWELQALLDEVFQYSVDSK